MSRRHLLLVFVLAVFFLLVAGCASSGRYGHITVQKLSVKSGGIDMLGNKIDLDDANTTSITADTDNQIDVELNGADDFQFTANTFTALSGSTVKADTIAETTAANGVAIDSVTLKDGGVVLTAGSSILPTSGITNTGATFVGRNSIAYTDTSNKAVFVVPANADIIDWTFDVTTAFDDTGTDVVDCGTTAGDPDEYVDALDVSAAGVNRMGDAADMPDAGRGDVGASNILVLCKYTGQNANASAGAATLLIEYMID